MGLRIHNVDIYLLVCALPIFAKRAVLAHLLELLLLLRIVRLSELIRGAWIVPEAPKKLGFKEFFLDGPSNAIIDLISKRNAYECCSTPHWLHS